MPEARSAARLRSAWTGLFSLGRRSRSAWSATSLTDSDHTVTTVHNRQKISALVTGVSLRGLHACPLTWEGLS